MSSLKYLQKNSSIKNLSRKFQIIKQNKDQEKLQFQTDNTKNYNQLFSKNEQKILLIKFIIYS